MIQVYQIPVDGYPQSFGINLIGVTYNLTFKWNASQDAGWIMDIADINNNFIATGIPLITGDDCLDGLQYLGIGGSIWILNAQDNSAVPTFTNFGTDCLIYFQTDS